MKLKGICPISSKYHLPKPGMDYDSLMNEVSSGGQWLLWRYCLNSGEYYKSKEERMWCRQVTAKKGIINYIVTDHATDIGQRRNIIRTAERQPDAVAFFSFWAEDMSINKSAAQ